MRRFAVLVVVLLAAACQSAPPRPITSTTVAGTVIGAPVTVTDVVSLYGTDSVSGAPYAGALIADQPVLCSALQSGLPLPPASAWLTLQVFHDGSSAPLPLGSHNVAASTVARYQTTDADCHPLVDEQASAGTITVLTSSAREVTGTFDLRFPGGDHLTGQWKAPVCGFDPHGVGALSPATCGARDQ